MLEAALGPSLGEWEVVSRPVSLRGGKSVRARVQVPGRPETEREDTWEAHQRITVRRAVKAPAIGGINVDSAF